MFKKEKLKKGAALLFVMMILVSLSVFTYSLYDISVNTTQFGQVMISSYDSDYMAEVGIKFYVHQLNSMTVQGQLTEDMNNWLQAELAAKQRRYWGQEGAFFFLQEVNDWSTQPYAEYQFHLKVVGVAPAGFNTAKHNFFSLVDTAFAQSEEATSLNGQAVRCSMWESIIGADFDKGGSYGIVTGTAMNVSSNSHQVYSYPGTSIINVPSISGNLNLNSGVTSNTDTSLINARMQKIIDEANLRLQEAEDLIDNGTQVTKSLSSINVISLGGSKKAFHFPTSISGSTNRVDNNVANYYNVNQMGNSNISGTLYNNSNSNNREIVFSSKDIPGYGSGAQDNDNDPDTYPHEKVPEDRRNVIFGAPGKFSKMRFRHMTFIGDKWNIRFYPGIYEFEIFQFGKLNHNGSDKESNRNKIFMDTTSGPVFISLPEPTSSSKKSAFLMRGKENALFVYKDKTYTGKDVQGRDVNPNNEVNYYGETTDDNGYKRITDDSNKSQNQVDYDSRMIARWMVETKSYSDKEWHIKGNDNLIGAVAVGDGGNATIGMADVPNSASHGSEVKKSGNKYVLNEADATNTPVTAESMIMYGGPSMEFNIDGNNNTLVGGYFCNQCGNHSNEFMLKGGNNNLYGGISNKGRIQFSGGSAAIYLDSRLHPFPPSAEKASVKIDFRRRLNEVVTSAVISSSNP